MDNARWILGTEKCGVDSGVTTASPMPSRIRPLIPLEIQQRCEVDGRNCAMDARSVDMLASSGSGFASPHVTMMVPSKMTEPSLTYTLNPWISASHRQSLERPLPLIRSISKRPRPRPPTSFPLDLLALDVPQPLNLDESLSEHDTPADRNGLDVNVASAEYRFADEFLCFPSSASTTYEGYVVDVSKEEATDVTLEGVSGGDQAWDGGIGLSSGCADDDYARRTEDTVEDRRLSASRSEVLPVTEDVQEAVLSLTERYLQELRGLLASSTPDAGSSRTNISPEESGDGSSDVSVVIFDGRFDVARQAVKDLWCLLPGSGHTRRSTDNEQPRQGPLHFVRYATGPWRDIEVDLLRRLVTQSRERRTGAASSLDRLKGRVHKGGKADKRNEDVSVDWQWVCGEMQKASTARSKHQILCKATELHLKVPLERRGKKRKFGAEELPSTEAHS